MTAAQNRFKQGPAPWVASAAGLPASVGAT